MVSDSQREEAQQLTRRQMMPSDLQKKAEDAGMRSHPLRGEKVPTGRQSVGPQQGLQRTLRASHGPVSALQAHEQHPDSGLHSCLAPHQLLHCRDSDLKQPPRPRDRPFCTYTAEGPSLNAARSPAQGCIHTRLQ